MTYSFKLARRIARLELAVSTPVRIGLMVFALVTPAGCFRRIDRPRGSWDCG